MNIALIMEYSQSAKNAVVEAALKTVADRHQHRVINYGQFSPDDDRLTYNEVGLMAALILNAKAADFVVTGCGTGMGAMLACNAFPGVQCGHAQEPIDAYLFAQVNGGNALSLPYAKGFGWGAELNLVCLFEQLFAQAPGGGYPPENAASEQRNAQILTEIKMVTHPPMEQILPLLDPTLRDHVFARPSFVRQFLADAQPGSLRDAVQAYVKTSAPTLTTAGF